MKLPLRLEKNSTRVFDKNNEYIMKFEKFPEEFLNEVIICINNDIKIVHTNLFYKDGYIQTPLEKIALMMSAVINAVHDEDIRIERANTIINRIQNNG